VRAGKVRRADEWHWSAHADLAGQAEHHPLVDRRRAYALLECDAAGYRRLVGDGDERAFDDLDAGRVPIGADLAARIAEGDEAALRHAVTVLGRSAASLAPVLGVSERAAQRRVGKVAATFPTPG
jgi:hypothetical protein